MSIYGIQIWISNVRVWWYKAESQEILNTVQFPRTNFVCFMVENLKKESEEQL